MRKFLDLFNFAWISISNLMASNHCKLRKEIIYKPFCPYFHISCRTLMSYLFETLFWFQNASKNRISPHCALVCYKICQENIPFFHGKHNYLAKIMSDTLLTTNKLSNFCFFKREEITGNADFFCKMVNMKTLLNCHMKGKSATDFCLSFKHVLNFTYT